MKSNAATPEVKKLLDKYDKLKKEADDLKASDPLKSEQKKMDATPVSREIEKLRG